jgi:GNAT superfamily N-acetyltransferase
VFHVFVDRRWQRRGVARRLWQAARDTAQAQEGHAGVFTVNASNYSVRFYAALGFQRSAPMQVARVCYNPMRLGSVLASLVGPA